MIKSLTIILDNLDIDFDINLLDIKELILLGMIISKFISLASIILDNDINNNDVTLSLIFEKNKSLFNSVSLSYPEWGVMDERKIIFYLDYFDSLNRRDNVDKDLLRILLLPAGNHYLSRELEIKDEEEYLIIDNNFISNMIDDIISNVINSFNNNNNFIDPDVNNLAEDEEDEGDIEVDSLFYLFLAVTHCYLFQLNHHLITLRMNLIKKNLFYVGTQWRCVVSIL